jgi:Zn-finger nucleic acid-binding protein
MNVPEAAHCSGCGWQLGLEPMGEADTLKCPDCKTPLAAFAGGPGILRDCGSCGGQFVEHALLRDLIERREVYGLVAPRHTATAAAAPRAVRYVPCPVCKQMMNRQNFGRSSGVIVDTCRAHGIWFDRGELPRVLVFVESGGLARARRRELEELERQRREVVRHQLSPGPVTGHEWANSVEDRVSLVKDAAECVQVLLEAVAGLLPRTGSS